LPESVNASPREEKPEETGKGCVWWLATKEPTLMTVAFSGFSVHMDVLENTWVGH
jgi:hypothetical protein